MFTDIAYLDWISGRPERATHDLGSSDLRRPEPDANGVVPPALSDLPDPQADATLESLLASEYGASEGNVLVTAGASHANFLALAAAMGGADGGDGGDSMDGEDDPRVLVEEPGYEPLAATPEGLGARVDRFRRPASDGYALDPNRIGAAIDDDTACVVVTNRHNPGGTLTDRETLAEASDVAAENGATLLVDEVYAPFGAERVAGSAFGGPTAAGLPNAVVTNSLTKFHGFGPLRIGWLVADAEFVERARSVAHHVPALADPSVALARRALSNEEGLADESRARVADNRDTLAAFVEGRDDLSGRVASGCTYGFFAHETADGTEVAEAAWEEGILVVPGRFFGNGDRFRLSLGHDGAAVRPGLDAFGRVLDAL